ncbi:CPBP family intramembrane metalloprotease, partial [bacterium AH-315-P07]|nr:CPBP family intramembrane metalloprotease [bacterium AH-315-P07]
DSMLESRLSARELPEGFARPLAFESDNIATMEKSTGTVLGTILPLIMVMMLGIGAFYPAVDLTAGEKERGTFETLLSTPATKLEIVVGKFFAVFALSMLTGLLNLASMTVTFYFQFSQIVSQRDILPEGEQLISISPMTVAAIALLLIPLAFFISAIMMSVAVLARSFKEAQNYVTPVFILIIMPVMAVSFPGVELNSTTQFIPISNIALLFRDLLSGQAQMQYFFTVFMCTSVYALMSLVVATWMFQSEEVILSEDKGIPLTLDRRAFTPSKLPTLGTSLGIFSIVMLLLFYVGAWAQGRNIHAGLLITQYLLIFAPVVAVLRYIKVDLRSALNLKKPAPFSVLAVFVVTIPWVLINIQIATLQNKVLPIPDEFAEAIAPLFELGGNETLATLALLFIIAVSPAICEEVLFRGVITTGLRRVLSGWATVLVVGVLFGLFHMSIYRVLGTGLTGILLTYFVIRSGSIYLPMIGHFINNAIAVMFETESVPESWIVFLEEQNIDESGFPVTWIVIAVVVMIAGIILFEKTLPKATDDAVEKTSTT